MSQLKYNLFDLNKVNSEFPPDEQYTLPCDICGEPVSQEDDECIVCGAPVVWLHSKTWRRLYGSPEARIRELTRPIPDDDDELGQELLATVGLAGFANISQKRRWDKIRGKVPQAAIREEIEYAMSNTYRRGVLPRVLNWGDKYIREHQPSKKKGPRWTGNYVTPPPPEM